MPSKKARLTEIEPHEIGVPRDLPTIPATEYRRRLDATYAAMDARGLDALAVYGDREHFANTAFLTGFDPRYEESLMILIPGRTPMILVGNENVAYASIAPYPIDVVRQSKFSLNGQPDPDDRTLDELLNESGIAGPSVRTIGTAGWKIPAGRGTGGWNELPHFIVAALQRFGTVENATDLFVGPGSGLRLRNDVNQIAYFEFAASHGSAAMERLIGGIQPGMTELEASSLLQPIMLPFNYHPTMLGGARNTGFGVASPGGRALVEGDPVAAGIGYWGSNTARAGFLVADHAELPADAADYVERLVAPYYETAAAWYETIRIGLTAGELFEVTASRLSDPFYGVFLNPGHYIHLDEWPSSPVRADSPVVFESGNAVQLDIIPGTGTSYHTAQIEDGVVLADAVLRERLKSLYPDAWTRIQARRSRLANVFGIDLNDDVLPLSNTAGYFPPFWLAPNRAMVMA